MLLEAHTILLLMAFTALPTALVLLAVLRGGRNRVVAAYRLEETTAVLPSGGRASNVRAGAE